MNAIVEQHRQPALAVADLAQQSRQRIARSRPAELLANEADEAEIAAAFTDELRRDLALAIAGIGNEMLTPFQNEALEDQLTIELGKYMRLTAGGWHADDKAEWINGATDELASLPAALVLPEVVIARRREPWPNKLVARVCEAIEPRVARLEAERAKLEKLQEIADHEG